MASNLSAVYTLNSFCSIFFIFSISCITASAVSPLLPPVDHEKVYLVYLKGSNGGRDQYLSVLRKVVGSEAASRIIYSYRIFNGFAAKLTYSEQYQLSKLEEVAFIYPEEVYHLEPVRPDFLSHRPILP